MSYRAEREDLVISGFEKGIADSPELGIGDMRSVNITSVPGEVSTSFSTVAASVPPTGQSGLAFTAAAATGLYTVAATTNYYNGMAVKLDTTSTPLTVQALVVGGGGAGGGVNNGVGGAGGGGAGGFQYNAALAVAKQAYTITVGAGGTGASAATGGDGNASSIGSLLSANAGGGGGGVSASAGSNGNPGGSGGGGGGSTTGGTGGVGSAGQGSTGGIGAASAGGGGGGASAVGTAGTGGGTGGNGGNGTANSISGASVTYAGGGGAGGGGGSGAGGSGGTGGGGAGHSGSGNGTAGTTNTGGGGGGAATNSGGSFTGGGGGSGIVIISYPTGSLTATGGTITTSGGNTIHTFTTSGTWTITATNPPLGVYYIGSLTATTFKLYYDLALGTQATVLKDYSGTYDVPSFGTPIDKAQNNSIDGSGNVLAYTFLLDTSGNCWYVNYSGGSGTTANSLQYTGNTGHSATGSGADFGIAINWGYVFVMIGTNIDYLLVQNLFASTGPQANWIYGWKTINATTHQHRAVVGTDDSIYICNNKTVASLLEDQGAAFNPTDTSTFSFTAAACTLPVGDAAQCLSNLGGQVPLLIGGINNNVYQWSRVLLVPDTALICADANILRIVSTNSNAYVFAGNRGRIYITNGSQLQLYKKLPDALSGNPEPYYTWGDALYLRNKLYFTFTATDNAGNALNTMGGFWALGIDAGQTQIALPTAGSLYNSNQLSYGTYGGSCPVLFYNQLATPAGYGVCGAWTNSSVTGVDVGSTAPYTGTQSYIDTDIIPVGTFFAPKTFKTLEYKLSKPMVAGETLKVSYRTNLTDTYTDFFTSSVTKLADATNQLTFEKAWWVQFRITLTSTASSPSYVRLTELRFR